MVLPAAAQAGQFESEVAGPTEQTERQAGSADVQLTEGLVYFAPGMSASQIAAETIDG